MLVQATPADHDLIEAMWLAPANANWVEPPEPGEVAAAIGAGFAFLWVPKDEPVGFAVLMTWVPRVMGISVIACTEPGQGAPFLRAILDHIFGTLNAHRIGLDVTADNTRALRLYERLGFIREGQVRECWLRPAGDWTDCILLGLLAREWSK